MSNDYYVVSGDSLRDVADKIREKGGTSAQLEYPDDWKDAINAISGGGDEPIPEDGKTRIWIHIAEETPDNRLTFYLQFTASEADNTTVDWGDGVSETLGDTVATNYSHKYPSGGNYIITMTVNSGTISFEGDSNNRIYGEYANSNTHNRIRIQKVIIGDSMTNIGMSAFNSCYTLVSITIPDGVTSIGANTFQACYGLTSITIPDGVTDIGTYAFRYCYSMSEYHFKPIAPPTLANSNAFNGIPSDCIIYVPQGCLSAYQSATNYGNVASQMQEEPT